MIYVTWSLLYSITDIIFSNSNIEVQREPMVGLVYFYYTLVNNEFIFIVDFLNLNCVSIETPQLFEWTLHSSSRVHDS
jgi:hypothetical protein